MIFDLDNFIECANDPEKGVDTYLNGVYLPEALFKVIKIGGLISAALIESMFWPKNLYLSISLIYYRHKLKKIEEKLIEESMKDHRIYYDPVTDKWVFSNEETIEKINNLLKEDK